MLKRISQIVTEIKVRTTMCTVISKVEAIMPIEVIILAVLHRQVFHTSLSSLILHVHILKIKITDIITMIMSVIERTLKLLMLQATM